MKAFPEFMGMDTSFWAFIKFISETLGYTERGKGKVKSYFHTEIIRLCEETNTFIDMRLINAAVEYLNQRSKLLNDEVQYLLMDAETARSEFDRIFEHYNQNNFLCNIPLNKQKGDMRQVAYYTAIINIIAEDTIRRITRNSHDLGFDDDPRGLSFIWDEDGYIIGGSSRRFDGAYPSIQNPRLVWEIKEYYYATTFGSRVADGVYETQLDGYEFKELFERTGIKVYHVLFVDAYRTWWAQGKSYLCRLIDTLNSGLVDEVIFGREVFTRWSKILEETLLD